MNEENSGDRTANKSSSATADHHRWRQHAPCPSACARAHSQWMFRDVYANNRVNMWERQDRCAWWHRAPLVSLLRLSCLCGDTKLRDCSGPRRRQDQWLVVLQIALPHHRSGAADNRRYQVPGAHPRDCGYCFTTSCRSATSASGCPSRRSTRAR